jgi:precorrin-6A/cobalt-precorrin-6A reductase
MRRTSTKICNELNINHLLINRPEWKPEKSDEWHYINNLIDLENIIPVEANVFVGTGKNTLNQFHNMSGRKLLCRVIDKPEARFPFESGRYLIGEPPFSIQEEIALFEKYNIDWIVAKNSGGSGGFSKILAARMLNIPVVLLNRPRLPSSNKAENVDEALQWIRKLI